MPLEEPNQIDLIAKGKDGKMVLCITDSGVTADPAKRLEYLIQKLKAYGRGVASGALAKSYPNHGPRDFIIRVVCARRPTPEMTGISQIVLRGDPEEAIAVEYEEYPEGAWSRPEEAAPEGEWPADLVREADAESEATQSPFIVAGQKGLIMAQLYMKQGKKGFLFLVVGSDAGDEVVKFCEEPANNEMMDQAEQYIRDLPAAFTFCFVVTVSRGVKIGDKEHDAILMMCYERSQPKGMLHAMPIRPKEGLQEFEVLGGLEFLGNVPNLMASGG